MVCFCPFTYNISAYGDIKDTKNIRAVAKLGWFLWIIRMLQNRRIFHKVYENEKLKVIVRIFGIPINLTKEKKARKKEPEKNKDNNEIEVYEPLSYNESVDEINDLDLEESFEKEAEAESDKTVDKKDKKAKLKEEQSRVKSEKKKDRQAKLKKLKEAYETFKKQETKETIKLVKGIIIKTFRHVLPRRYKGHVNYGFEDPCTTGQVLAGIAAVYPVFKGKLSVVPYFDTKDMILYGDINVRGRIVIFFFIIQIIKVWNNKTIRELIKKAR